VNTELPSPSCFIFILVGLAFLSYNLCLPLRGVVDGGYAVGSMYVPRMSLCRSYESGCPSSLTQGSLASIRFAIHWSMSVHVLLIVLG
jgi:hypothetical protein